MSEQLGSLQITEEASERTTEYTDKMLIVLVLAQESNEQAGLPKNMISDPGWFDRDRTKFKDWWRGMRLFLKSNRVMKTDDKITVILAHLRRDIADIYVQKKLGELNEETEIQD